MKPLLFPPLLLVAALALAQGSGGGPPDPQEIQIRRAVFALGSSDPQKRQAAIDTLLQVGAPARRALLEAARDEDPAVRAAAAQVLQKLPWSRPDDPPDFRDLLANYGRADVDGRRQIIASLAQMSHGYGVLARLVVEEPDDSVKWAVVTAVQQTFAKADLEPFRRLDALAPGATAPLAAAAGHAWFSIDSAKGVALLRRALDLYFRQPSDDAGEIDVLAERLGAMAILAGDTDQAARIQRRLAARPAQQEDPTPAGVLALFALHARIGPLPGFGHDADAHAGRLNDTRTLFCVSRAYRNTGQDLLACSGYTAAYAATIEDSPHRLVAGDFLFRQGWLDWSQAQWTSSLALAQSALERANSHFRLAQVDAAREDDAGAAEHLRQAMGAHHQGEGELRGTTEDAVEQEILWHDLRAARTRGNLAAARKAADALMSSPSWSKPENKNPDIAIDLVLFFEQAGRAAEAQKVFTTVYHMLKAELASQPDHPQVKNNIAWLCARTGRNKQEAVELARQASAALPDNPALLDTLGEASCQCADYAGAIRVEERALKLRPNDLFLQRQVERFRAKLGPQ